MKRLSTSSRAALSVAALLASLSFVAWRQGRGMEVLETLDRVRDDIALATAETSELRRRIQYLESRGRVVEEARRRLGMHTPDAVEQMMLPGESP